MSTILADVVLNQVAPREAAQIRRLPRAVGLSLAAVATGAMWFGAIAAFRLLF